MAKAQFNGQKETCHPYSFYIQIVSPVIESIKCLGQIQPPSTVHTTWDRLYSHWSHYVGRTVDTAAMQTGLFVERLVTHQPFSQLQRVTL